MQKVDNRNSAIGDIARFLGLKPGEIVAVAWSFVYFFSLLSAYYMLRSVREAMDIGFRGSTPTGTSCRSIEGRRCSDEAR